MLKVSCPAFASSFGMSAEDEESFGWHSCHARPTEHTVLLAVMTLSHLSGPKHKRNETKNFINNCIIDYFLCFQN